MTGPLDNILYVGTNVHISVDKNMRGCYMPNFLHEVHGVICELDDEHVWVKFKINDTWVSGPHRYSWTDIMIEREE